MSRGETTMSSEPQRLRDLLRAALVDGTLEMEVLFEILVEHLATCCPECRAIYQSFVEEYGPPPSLDDSERPRLRCPGPAAGEGAGEPQAPEPA